MAGLDKIGTAALLSDALKSARARPVGLLVYLGVTAGLLAALEISGPAFGMSVDADAGATSVFRYSVAAALIGGVSEALYLRTLLGEPIRANRELLAGAGLLTVATFVLNAPVYALPIAVRTLPPSTVVLVGPALVIALLASVPVLIRLTLWPVGWVAGERTMTAARSWALTRGAAWGLIGANLVVGVVILVAFTALTTLTELTERTQTEQSSAYVLFLTQVLVATAAAASAAFSVAVFARRVTASSALRDVFA